MLPTTSSVATFSGVHVSTFAAAKKTASKAASRQLTTSTPLISLGKALVGTAGLRPAVGASFAFKAGSRLGAPLQSAPLTIVSDPTQYENEKGQSKELFDTLRFYQLVNHYETLGFMRAKTDPLELPVSVPYRTHSLLQQLAATERPSFLNLGFTEKDLDREFECKLPGYEGFVGANSGPMTLRTLVDRLETIYCGSIGVEVAHITDSNVRNFFRKRLETVEPFKFDDRTRRRILIRTIRAQLFENFCYSKFPTAKRFGLDGCETMVVAMKEIAKRASAKGVDNIVIGMPHRGRLNLLMNVMHKPLHRIVGEFKGVTGFNDRLWGAMGDVKYHLGVDYSHFDRDSQRIRNMSVLPNPSHLEAINPLVLGYARAEQYYSGDAARTKTLPIVFHGDASIAGQGIVYETIQMSKLRAYEVGGCVHMVVNNQIGFTTNVVDAGSGKSCVSIAKAIDAPIFHVNADDPEAVTRVAQLALDYRQEFKGDVFINLIGYRRYGHNELDMPKFTQPTMYNEVDKHPPVMELFGQKLIDEGVVDKAYVEKQKKETLDFYNAQYNAAKNYKPSGNTYTAPWKDIVPPTQISVPRPTGVPMKRLKSLGTQLSTLPASLTPHPNIQKIYDARLKAIETGTGIDFGTAEHLALGSLLQDGFHVRLAGQDCQRGTFSHRHAVVHDQNKFTSSYCPLQNLKTKNTFEVHNSLLSEYGALGFEFGYSMVSPESLAIWEAQFGDFANGAQIIIDQFIASAEVKWTKQNGLVLLLPHGYDGLGPEHSSARVERFLQLCDDREDVVHPDYWNPEKRSVIQKHNIQVVIPSTPSQHFHVLRRQQCRGFRKPLVVFASKKLLKLRAAQSTLEEMSDSNKFHRYIPDTHTQHAEDVKKIERLVVCTGQVYYELAAHRNKTKEDRIAIARVEELSPFPFDSFIDDVKRYPNLKHVVWTQEEPMNAGAWSYVSRRMSASLKCLSWDGPGVIYVGRNVSATPAAGDLGLHNAELDEVLKDCFDLQKVTNSHFDKYV
eukprot:Lankesteria_metandrocarpae@DN8128_c0_g1_i1.p1